jgi:DnaK suppressor protein
MKAKTSRTAGGSKTTRNTTKLISKTPRKTITKTIGKTAKTKVNKSTKNENHKPSKVETKKEKRERLLHERAEAGYELGRLREQMKTEIEHDTEDGDPDVYEREKILAVIESLEERIDSVDHALKALEQGQYGICERCGLEISAERLKAMPDTTLCVKCKAETEKLLKRGFINS